MRDLFQYWTTKSASVTRIEYQINKAGHGLLIGLALAAVCQLVHVHASPLVLTIGAVLVYWSADWWAPFADHVHTSDHPVTHFTAKLLVGVLAPVLLVALSRPWVLVVWFVVYLPVLLLRL